MGAFAIRVCKPTHAGRPKLDGDAAKCALADESKYCSMDAATVSYKRFNIHVTSHLRSGAVGCIRISPFHVVTVSCIHWQPYRRVNRWLFALLHKSEAQAPAGVLESTSNAGKRRLRVPRRQQLHLDRLTGWLSREFWGFGLVLRRWVGALAIKNAMSGKCSTTELAPRGLQ